MARGGSAADSTNGGRPIEPRRIRRGSRRRNGPYAA